MLACRRVAIKLSALLLLLPLVAGQARAQQGADCPPSRTPIKLNFKTLQPTPVHNHRLTIQGIANLLRLQGGAPPSGARALGVTVTKTMFEVQGGSAAVRRGAGFCAYLTSVDVDFGWRRVEVYVPSEFPKGTCEYNTVIDHENQHVAINRALLREFAPRMRARIEAILARTPPVFVRRPEGSADAAVAGLHAQLSGMLKEFEALHAQRNAAIDSPANYKALTAMCKDWGRTDGLAPAPPG